LPRNAPHTEKTKLLISKALKGKLRPAGQTHGHASLTVFGRSPTYSSWKSMIRRCTCPHETGFHNYGGRGIKVCTRWYQFKNFLADLGERPPGMQLDRRNNNGHYTPSNCKWSTKKEQANNRRTNRRLTYKGRRRTVTEWAVTLGLNPTTIAVRLHRGCSIEQALRQPWT